MIESKNAYGIMVMDGKDATLAIVKGTITKIIKTVHSTAHSKIRKGGQSSARYQRLIEGAIHQYYVRIGESMDRAFLNKGLKGVIIGGPGPTKEYFLKEKTINYQIKILGIVDTGYTDEYGVREVISKSSEIMIKEDIIKEKKLVEQFIKLVVKGGLATYGLNEVKQTIESNKTNHIIVSEELPYKRVIFKCMECGAEETIILREDEEIPIKRCSKCNSTMQVDDEENLTDYFILIAKKHRIKIDMISTNTAEGIQFLQGFGGIGAFELCCGVGAISSRTIFGHVCHAPVDHPTVCKIFHCGRIQCILPS